MKRLFILLVIFTIFASPQITFAQVSNAPWPASNANMKRDGRTNAVGPSKPIIRWAKGNMFSRTFAQLRGFTVDHDKLYAVAGQGGMAAFRKTDGTRLWEFVVRDVNNGNKSSLENGDALEPWINYAPTIGADGRLYITSEWGHITAHDPATGKAYWFADIGKAEMSVAIDKDTVYTSGWADHFFAFKTTPDPLDSTTAPKNQTTNRTKWKNKFNQGFTYGAPAIGSDGTIYYAFDGVQAFYPEYKCPGVPTSTACGTQLKWRKYINPQTPVPGDSHAQQYGFYGPALDEERQALYWTMWGGIFAVDTDTHQEKWRHIDTRSNNRGRIPVIGRDGTVYVGADNGLYIVDHRDGSYIRKDIGRVEGNSIIDGNGYVYVYVTGAGGIHYLYSYTPIKTASGEPDLAIRPNYPFAVGKNDIGGFSDHQIAMDSDGTIYLPTGLNHITAVAQDGPPLPTSTPDPNIPSPTPTKVPTPTPTRAPIQTGYLSNQNWISAQNGDGPVLRDKANTGVAGGGTITLNGQTYTKGLGTHANADIRYDLGDICNRFTAQVGVDDSTGDNGSVIFQVFADGTKLFDSGIMTGSSATKTIDVNTAGKLELQLVVTNGGDNWNYDRANWADAKISCITGDPITPSSSTQKPGDTNGDTIVNVQDYNTLVTQFNQSGDNLSADFNNSGKVDVQDYNILVTNFGK